MPFSRYPSGSCPCQVSLPFELRHFPAGSLSPLSRIEFVSYRLVVLLRLLPTPPHDDAVAVEYGPENVCPVGTFTLLFKCAYERTGRTLRGPPQCGRTLRLRQTGGFPSDKVIFASFHSCFQRQHAFGPHPPHEDSSTFDSSSCRRMTLRRAFAPPALPDYYAASCG